MCCFAAQHVDYKVLIISHFAKILKEWIGNTHSIHVWAQVQLAMYKYFINNCVCFKYLNILNVLDVFI